MDTEIIHLEKSRLGKHTNVFLLLIPSIVFALTLAFIVSKYYRNNLAASIENEAVLGEEAEKPSQ